MPRQHVDQWVFFPPNIKKISFSNSKEQRNSSTFETPDFALVFIYFLCFSFSTITNHSDYG